MVVSSLIGVVWQEMFEMWSLRAKPSPSPNFRHRPPLILTLTHRRPVPAIETGALRRSRSARVVSRCWSNGLLKQHQAGDRHAVGKACLAVLEQWAGGHGARATGQG